MERNENLKQKVRPRGQSREFRRLVINKVAWSVGRECGVHVHKAMGTFSIDCGGTPKLWAVVTKHLLAGSDWFHHSEGQEAMHMPCQVQRGGMFILHHLHVDFETSAYEDERVTSRTRQSTLIIYIEVWIL